MRYKGYVRMIKRRIVACLIASIGLAYVDGERAISASLNWATFSAPGKPMGNRAPPTLSPDIGGALAVSYEQAVSTDVSLRAELAGGAFYGGGMATQPKTSYALLGDAGVTY